MRSAKKFVKDKLQKRHLKKKLTLKLAIVKT